LVFFTKNILSVNIVLATQKGALRYSNVDMHGTARNATGHLWVYVRVDIYVRNERGNPFSLFPIITVQNERKLIAVFLYREIIQIRICILR